jgi:hypothetical protein
MGFLIWCYYPSTKGAKIVYDSVIKPYIVPALGLDGMLYVYIYLYILSLCVYTVLYECIYMCVYMYICIDDSMIEPYIVPALGLGGEKDDIYMCTYVCIFFFISTSSFGVHLCVLRYTLAYLYLCIYICIYTYSPFIVPALVLDGMLYT